MTETPSPNGQPTSRRLNMPSTIPYDPSLTLMSVVSYDALQRINAAAEAQAPADEAMESLASLTRAKLGLQMTEKELRNLGIPTDSIQDELNKLRRQVEHAAVAYAAARAQADARNSSLKDKARASTSGGRSIESPVDYILSEIKSLPLAADSMNMDVQYFAHDSESQSAESHGFQIAAHVNSAACSVFSSSTCQKVSSEISRQIRRDLGKERIQGTLVLSVARTHKNAAVVAPLVLNVDKGIKVWNSLFPGDKMDATDRKSMMEIAMKEKKGEEMDDKKRFSIISGTTFGSAFVAMVHILDSDGRDQSEALTAAADSLKTSMDRGTWLASDIKDMFDQRGKIESQVSLLAMGVIPSMAATEIAVAVDKFSHLNSKEKMEALAGIQNVNSEGGDQNMSVRSVAEALRSSGQAPPTSVENKAAVEDALTMISSIGESKNRTLNVDSMTAALDDYLKKSAEEQGGVPINYFLKDFDQKVLAQMWLAKYFPGAQDAAGPTN